MKLAVVAFTRRGCGVARKAVQALNPSEYRLYTMEKFQQPDFLPYTSPLDRFVGQLFGWADQLVFVGSCGIAVRGIAPWLRDKKTDPGVIVVDEGGSFVIPILSGHIGGANALATELAKALGAQSVLTTATDVNRRFAVDEWAARQGLIISDMGCAKAVAARILEQSVPLCCDFPLASALPSGTHLGTSGDLGIYIGCCHKRPYSQTLQLIPRVLHLGIGCRRNTSQESIQQAVESVLAEHGISREAICCAASIDLKADEAGLLAFCDSWKLPVQFYSARTLLEVPGEFTPSGFVQSITGVDNVCERAAMVGSDKVIVRKTAVNGVTVALAQEKWEANFTCSTSLESAPATMTI